MNYKLIQTVLYGYSGSVVETKYYIKERKSFFGISYWRTIIHQRSGGYQPMAFSSINAAEKFILEVLKKSKFKNSQTEKLIAHYD